MSEQGLPRPFFVPTNKTREALASLSASNDYRVEHLKIAYDKGRYYLRESQVMMQERLHACRYVETVGGLSNGCLMVV